MQPDSSKYNNFSFSEEKELNLSSIPCSIEIKKN